MLGASQHNQMAAGHSSVLNRVSKAFHSRTVTLEPGAAKRVALGSYSMSDPRPDFEVTVAPPVLQEQTGSSMEQISIPGTQKFVAFCHLHNFSDKQCDITITKRS